MVNAIKPRSLILRGLGFLLIWGLLNGAAWHWGDQFARAVIPLYKYTFAVLTDHYELQSLRLELQREPYFKIAVKTTGDRVLNQMPVPNGIEITSQTLQGHAFQPAIVALSLLVIWPFREAWRRDLVLLMAVPGLFLVITIDIPLIFLGSLEDFVLFNFHPEALRHSMAVQCMHFLNGGGRLLLSILAVISSVLASDFLFSFNPQR